jgi:hypothetical protein
MIKDKYYTPTIEEFYVGFEYERIVPGMEYGKTIYDGFYSIRAYDWDTSIEEDIKDGEIRVKYLDKEDIESLGFITYDDTTFDKGDLQIRFNCLLRKKGQGLGLVIYDRYSGIIFTGYIKNKSELIKLFKQLDINE